jgi:hypothetical protein
MISDRALVRNARDLLVMQREQCKCGITAGVQSTDAPVSVGSAHSSNEASVMEVEQRGRVVRFLKCVNRQMMGGTHRRNEAI